MKLKLEHMLIISGEHYYVYGDKPYIFRPYMQAFSMLHVVSKMRAFNVATNAMWVSKKRNSKELNQAWAE